MDNQKNHWIALYLSGQYPGKYTLSNRLRILFSIRQKDTTNFEEPTISYLHSKNDVEYYHTLLDTFEIRHWSDEYNQLLEELNIPLEVRKSPNTKIEQEDNAEGESEDELNNRVTTIWLITPFDDTWSIRKDILNEIAGKFWYDVSEVKMEKDSNEKFLWDSIISFLDKYELYVVDLRNQNLNVSIELWYILAKGKECIVITDQDLPSDIRWFKYVKPQSTTIIAWTWWLEDEKIEEMERNLKSDLWKAIKAKIKYLKGE